jgi:hypothetical protein
VKATSTYKGQTYGFCSEKCKKTFDEYPEAYVPPVLPRPVPAFTVKTLDGKEVSFESCGSGQPGLVRSMRQGYAGSTETPPEARRQGLLGGRHLH